MLTRFSYLAPDSKGELLEMLHEHADSARLLAGGTDLLVDIRAGKSKPAYVIDVKKIKELKALDYDEKEGLVIGPSARMVDIVHSKLINAKFPLLADAAHRVGSPQIRNRATVIGNVATASPCADTILPLLVMGAEVVLESKKKSRRIKLNEFLVGVKKTARSKDEVVTSIVVPTESANLKGGMEKLKRIKGHDLALASVAILKRKDSYRVAVGSCAITSLLVEAFPKNASADEIAEKTMAKICPIDDVRASADYRRFMVGQFVRRIMARLK
jgi:CO/xanthine dehydrogenase FAD-binding subunit